MQHVKPDGLPSVLDAIRQASPLPDRAEPFKQGVAIALSCAGWSVQTERFVSLPRSRRTGRIDIVASKGPCMVAIECDHRTPRRKSLNKLHAFYATSKLVVLRAPTPLHTVDGITIVGAEVYQ